jgi:protein SERAC1
LFFGTPHKGLLIDDIKQMVTQEGDHPRAELLEQIRLQSDVLTHQLADFKNLIRDRKIVSFFETQKTRRLHLVRFLCQSTYDASNMKLKDPETQMWGRTGSHMTAVDSESAILQLPDNLETKIPVNADHSHIVKFDSASDQSYRSTVKYLKQFEQDATKVIFDRFCMYDIHFAT